MNYNWVLQWPVEFSDMYFSIDEILIAEKHNINWKIFVEYYELMQENNKWNFINLYNFWRMKVLSPEVIEKEKQKDLTL